MKAFLPRFAQQANLLAALTFCILVVNCPSVLQAQEDKRVSEFEAVAKELLGKSGTPGAAIAIFDQQKLIYQRTFGFQDLEQKAPVTPETLFAIGSCTKAFTGLIAAKLVDDGKLDWEQPINEIDSRFQMIDPYLTQHVSIKDAFSHSTGLARHDMIWYDSGISRAALLEKLPHLEVSTSLRKRFVYNNAMFSIGGTILETVSEKSWDTMIRDEIFTPLGMNDSLTNYNQFIKAANRSTGYEPDGVTPVPHRNVDAVGPAGSITSNLKDMTKWLQFLVNQGNLNEKRIVSDEQFAFITSPQIITNPVENSFYGIGWDIRWKNGKKSIGHGGGIDGQNCFVKFVPDSGFGIVILANQQSDFDDLLVQYAADLFVHDSLKRDVEKEAAMVSRRIQKAEQIAMRNVEQHSVSNQTQSDQALPRKVELYLGTFKHPAYGDFKVSKTASGDLEYSLGAYKGPLLFSGPDQFVAVSQTMGSVPVNFKFNTTKNAYLTTQLQGGEPFLKFTFQGHRVVIESPRESLAEHVLQTAIEMGNAEATQAFNDLKDSEEYYLREDELNRVGYILLESANIDGAINVLRLNAKRYSESWNAWDSLGEAHAKNKDNSEAIRCYEKSIQLNPENKLGIEALKKLQSQQSKIRNTIKLEICD